MERWLTENQYRSVTLQPINSSNTHIYIHVHTVSSPSFNLVSDSDRRSITTCSPRQCYIDLRTFHLCDSVAYMMADGTVVTGTHLKSKYLHTTIFTYLDGRAYYLHYIGSYFHTDEKYLHYGGTYLHSNFWGCHFHYFVVEYGVDVYICSWITNDSPLATVWLVEPL